jgi:hypothetical protein
MLMLLATAPARLDGGRQLCTVPWLALLVRMRRLLLLLLAKMLLPLLLLLLLLLQTE